MSCAKTLLAGAAICSSNKRHESNKSPKLHLVFFGVVQSHPEVQFPKPGSLKIQSHSILLGLNWSLFFCIHFYTTSRQWHRISTALLGWAGVEIHADDTSSCAIGWPHPEFHVNAKQEWRKCQALWDLEIQEPCHSINTDLKGRKRNERREPVQQSPTHSWPPNQGYHDHQSLLRSQEEQGWLNFLLSSEVIYQCD